MGMFCDQTSIQVIAGKGGDGYVHFHREKFVARGGPDGGDGGRGGSVIFEGDENTHTLIDLHSKRIIKGGDGEGGDKNDQTGKSADDLIVKVPVGTIVSEIDAKGRKKIIADITKHKEQFIIAKGGKGGFGNRHYKSSRYQVPRFAENGEPGEEKNLALELRMIADVGVIGLPSAGKSTLLNVITRANAKVGPYPFTTLSPNLGVVNLTRQYQDPTASFIMADIPGLIEGAHEGKGLGHEFLRHISRTKVLIHLIDITNENPKEAKKIIENELIQHDRKMKQKKQILAFSKADLIEKSQRPKLKDAFYISAATGEGVDELLKATWLALKAQNEEDKKREREKKAQEEHVILKPYEDSKKAFAVKKGKKVGKIRYFEVTGQRIEQIASMTNITEMAGLVHMRHLVKKLGIQRALISEGAKEKDIITIGKKTFSFKII